MTFSEIVALVPEDRRAAAKAELDGAVKVASREDAERLISTNQFMKAVIDSGISKTVAEHDERFMKEKLPGLVEEGVKARMPKPKDPELAAALERVERLEAENRKAQSDAVRERQRSRAIAQLSSKGLPEKLAEYYLGESDEQTDAKLAMALEHLEAWKEKAVTEARVALVGNQGVPPKGAAPANPMDFDARIQAAEARHAEAMARRDTVAAMRAADEAMHWQSEARKAAGQ